MYTEIVLKINQFPIIPFAVTGIMLVPFIRSTKSKTMKKYHMLIVLAPIAWGVFSIYNLIPKYEMAYTIIEVFVIIPALMLLALNSLMCSVIEAIERKAA